MVKNVDENAVLDDNMVNGAIERRVWDQICDRQTGVSLPQCSVRG